MSCFSLLLRPLPPTSTLFPYTTLFRSHRPLRSLAPGSATPPPGRRHCRPPRYRLSTADRKSTRLNSSHRCISYAVFCLKKKMMQRPYDLRDHLVRQTVLMRLHVASHAG